MKVTLRKLFFKFNMTKHSLRCCDTASHSFNKLVCIAVDGETLFPGRFGHFRWPYSHADQWVQPPARGFLFVFYNIAPKCTVLSYRAWDRLTDGQIALSCNAPGLLRLTNHIVGHNNFRCFLLRHALYIYYLYLKLS